MQAGSQPGSIKLEVLPTIILSIGNCVGTVPFSLSPLLFSKAWLVPGKCCLVDDMLLEDVVCHHGLAVRGEAGWGVL